MINTQRIQTPDLLKGLAVIFMIQVHLMELFAQQDLYDGLIGKISLFLGGVPAAPVFMIVMGYFLASGSKGFKELSVRGTKLFIAGIILNIGLNFHLIYNITFKGWVLNIWQYIFGVDILHLAGLSIIAIAFLSLLNKKNWLLYFIVAIGVAALSSILMTNTPENEILNYLQAFFLGGAEWSYFPLIPWLAYPLTGYAFKLFEIKYLKGEASVKLKISLIGVFGVLFIFTASYATNISHNLKEYYSHGIIFYFWAISFVILLASVVSILEREAGDSVVFKYIKWLGKNVTIIYIFQWLLIGNIATSIYKTQNLAEIIVWFVGITVLTSILAAIWIKAKSVYKLDFLKL